MPSLGEPGVRRGFRSRVGFRCPKPTPVGSTTQVINSEHLTLVPPFRLHSFEIAIIQCNVLHRSWAKLATASSGRCLPFCLMGTRTTCFEVVLVLQESHKFIVTALGFCRRWYGLLVGDIPPKQHIPCLCNMPCRGQHAMPPP